MELFWSHVSAGDHWVCQFCPDNDDRHQSGPKKRVCLRDPYSHYILYYTILYDTISYYTILYYTIVYYTILYYSILYYTRL